MASDPNSIQYRFNIFPTMLAQIVMFVVEPDKTVDTNMIHMMTNRNMRHITGCVVDDNYIFHLAVLIATTVAFCNIKGHNENIKSSSFLPKLGSGIRIVSRLEFAG